MDRDIYGEKSHFVKLWSDTIGQSQSDPPPPILETLCHVVGTYTLFKKKVFPNLQLGPNTCRALEYVACCQNCLSEG